MTRCCECNHEELTVNHECDCACHLTRISALQAASIVFTMKTLKTPKGLIVGVSMNSAGITLNYKGGLKDGPHEDTDQIEVL